jgi:hypothetical protein
MFKVIVRKASEILSIGIFTTMEEANVWIEYNTNFGTFGAPAVYEDVQVLISEEVREDVQVLIEPATFDEFGVELTPAIYETQNVVVNPAVYETQSVLLTPAEFTIEIIDMADQAANEEATKDKIQLGRAARAACENVLDLIAGFNLDRELTFEQITEMQTLFSNPERALRASRPSTAKVLIQAITPDGVLVTQQMKDLCIKLLSDY